MSGLELVGAVASILAIVKLAKTIISMCRIGIDSFDGDSSEFRMIFIEVSTLNGMAESLHYLTKLQIDKSPLLGQLSSVMGAITGCEKALEELVTLFPADVISGSEKKPKIGKLTVAFAAIKWQWKNEKA
jgi:hypothetical protein